jgi:hypothetical protein
MDVWAEKKGGKLCLLFLRAGAGFWFGRWNVAKTELLFGRHEFRGFNNGFTDDDVIVGGP